MFDTQIRKLIDPALDWQGRKLAAMGATADGITLAGLALGLVSAGFIANGQFGAGLIILLLSRVADGLDGAVARATRPTDFGSYLDVTCDFLFYGAIPMAFVWFDPASNGAAGAFLLTSFYANGTSNVGYAILAEKHKYRVAESKSLYFTRGLLEGAETIGFFVLICLFPAWFVPLAWIFAVLCFVTGINRVLLARKVFGTA